MFRFWGDFSLSRYDINRRFQKMKWLIVGAIRFYWLVAPKWLRDRCLFKESCSHFVMNAAIASGARSAVQAFGERWRQCRPGYYKLSLPETGDVAVVLSDGSMVSPERLSDRVRGEFGLGL